MDKPCIVGCSELAVDEAGHCARLPAATLREGDWLSIDGEAGTIHLGRGKIVFDRPEDELAQIERWRVKPLEPMLVQAR